ncbi:MAG: hypothetical protein HC821_01150 [Lewinella sp.]|nr:hypothetical protein [Lewinella sp.]
MLGPWTGLQLSNFDLSNAGVGVVAVNWSGAPAGLQIPDETAVFELCFNTLSQPGCFSIDGNAPSEPSSTTTNGNGSIIFTDGQVCVDNRLKILSRGVQQTTCSNLCNGSVAIRAEAAGDNIGNVFIRYENPLRTLVNGDTLRNLCAGWKYFTIFNSGDPELNLRDSVFIEPAPGQVVSANAGTDRSLTCTANPFVLLGGANNQGVTFNLYRLQDGNQVLQGTGSINPDGSYSFSTRSEGVYLLEVLNAAGCSAFDTVEVFSPIFPRQLLGKTPL